MKNDGRQATVDCIIRKSDQYSINEPVRKHNEGGNRTMMEIYRTILGISPGFVVHAESTSSPIAAPSGFAKVANAVALVRPFSENHKSLYLVGAARANG